MVCSHTRISRRMRWGEIERITSNTRIILRTHITRLEGIIILEIGSRDLMGNELFIKFSILFIYNLEIYKLFYLFLYYIIGYKRFTQLIIISSPIILTSEYVLRFPSQIHYHWRLRYSCSYLGVGKSCLLLQYTDKRYRDKHEVTIGV